MWVQAKLEVATRHIRSVSGESVLQTRSLKCRLCTSSSGKTFSGTSSGKHKAFLAPRMEPR
jgi:hypothetical protein